MSLLINTLSTVIVANNHVDNKNKALFIQAEIQLSTFSKT